jgi:hypothetical protein
MTLWPYLQMRIVKSLDWSHHQVLSIIFLEKYLWNICYLLCIYEIERKNPNYYIFLILLISKIKKVFYIIISIYSQSSWAMNHKSKLKYAFLNNLLTESKIFNSWLMDRRIGLMKSTEHIFFLILVRQALWIFLPFCCILSQNM